MFNIFNIFKKEKNFYLLIVSEEVKINTEEELHEDIVDLFWEVGNISLSGQLSKEEWMARHPESAMNQYPFFVIMPEKAGEASSEEELSKNENEALLVTSVKQEVIDFLRENKTTPAHSSDKK